MPFSRHLSATSRSLALRLTLLVVPVTTTLVASSPQAQAAAKKKPAAKPKAAAAKATEPPAASAAEIEKVKGDFKWGTTPEEIIAKAQDRVRASYADRIDKAANDPSKQDRVRREMRSDVDKVAKNLVKFDGNKTGYETSIIDQEFAHKTGEAMLMLKEETSDRYFFFAGDRLYKMYIAFDKEMLRGKSFAEFGQLMQARFGKAKEITVEEKSKAGVKIKLDHYLWGSKGGDMLRLVDRSEFYDVFCLVVYDGKVAANLVEARKIANPFVEKKDSLVEAVTTGGTTDRDPNENVLDVITGVKVKKPGEVDNSNIVVPSVSGGRAPTAAEVNRREPEVPAKATKGKPSAPASNRPAETRGLEL